jgi:hypothetical protein
MKWHKLIQNSDLLEEAYSNEQQGIVRVYPYLFKQRPADNSWVIQFYTLNIPQSPPKSWLAKQTFVSCTEDIDELMVFLEIKNIIWQEIYLAENIQMPITPSGGNEGYIINVEHQDEALFFTLKGQNLDIRILAQDINIDKVTALGSTRFAKGTS